MSKRAAKARAIAVPSTFTGADLKPGPCEGTLQSRMKERCQSLDALKNESCIRRHASRRRHDWPPVSPVSTSVATIQLDENACQSSEEWHEETADA